MDIPVVAYTSHNSEMATARAKGFHSFLGKPLKQEHFPGQMGKILNNEAVWEVR
jgi:CheY-like chemotaxis protein